MAETIRYLITILPRVAERPSVQPAGGSIQSVILPTATKDALLLLITKIQAGVDVSTVVTAINAL
jgi:hypothetical protein